MTSITPTSGPLVGGTTVTITGTGFTGATTVMFGIINASSFTVNSATNITAISPAGSAGIVDITVTTPGGTSATSPADQFTYAPVPAVTSITPTSGPLVGGTTVTVTGTGFTGATTVMFGIINASSFTVNSATNITATSPAGAGTVDVTVTTPGGTSATSPADQFTYLGAPTTIPTSTPQMDSFEGSSDDLSPYVISISPSSGSIAGGTSVTLKGVGFTRATAVNFGSIPATNFVVVNDLSIIATTPASEKAGAVDVKVINSAGISTISKADEFTYSASTPDVLPPVSYPDITGNSFGTRIIATDNCADQDSNSSINCCYTFYSNSYPSINASDSLRHCFSNCDAGNRI